MAAAVQSQSTVESRADELTSVDSGRRLNYDRWRRVSRVDEGVIRQLSRPAPHDGNSVREKLQRLDLKGRRINASNGG